VSTRLLQIENSPFGGEILKNGEGAILEVACSMPIEQSFRLKKLIWKIDDQTGIQQKWDRSNKNNLENWVKTCIEG
jgi:hypothetical protein